MSKLMNGHCSDTTGCRWNTDMISSFPLVSCSICAVTFVILDTISGLFTNRQLLWAPLHNKPLSIDVYFLVVG